MYGRPLADKSQMCLGRKLPIPGAKATSIRFTEYPNQPAPLGSRTYFSTVTGAPRYIGTEVAIELNAVPRPQPFTYSCHYFKDNGDLIGRSSSVNLEIPAGLTTYTMWVSWGHRARNLLVSRRASR